MGTVRLPVVGMFAAGLATLLPAFLISCAIGEVTNNVTVGGIDYAFDAPDTLPPGPTAIAFENRGQVPHEMILVRLKKGVTLEEVMQAVQGGSDPSEFTEGGPGILIAEPGETAGSRLILMKASS